MPACLVKFHALFTATVEVNASYFPNFSAFNLCYYSNVGLHVWTIIKWNLISWFPVYHPSWTYILSRARGAGSPTNCQSSKLWWDTVRSVNPYTGQWAILTKAGWAWHATICIPLQALIPICSRLMVTPWCVSLSGCRGWLLRYIFSNFSNFE